MRCRSNERLPRITEVSLAICIFIKGKVVLHRLGCRAERQIRLRSYNVNRIAVRNVLCNSIGVSDRDIRIKVVRRSTGELESESHILERRDCNTVRAQVVPSRITVEQAVSLKATLRFRHARSNRERRRSANRARGISSALRRPNGIQRTDIHILRRERIKHAERFNIKHADNILTRSIQSPAGQASVCTAHNTEVLQ